MNWCLPESNLQRNEKKKFSPVDKTLLEISEIQDRNTNQLSSLLAVGWYFQNCKQAEC